MEDRKMRKKVLFLCTLYIASLSLILTGCNKNEPEQPAKVQTYHVSIQAGKGDANQQNGPRKALGLNGTTLTASWKEGERVSVRNVTKSTDLTGYLEAESDGVQTMISGDLTGTINAGDELLLRFLSPDYTNQQGTLAYIELHSDYAEATIHVASVTWGSITFVEGIADFENRQAIAKFTLMNEAKDAALAASDLKVEVDNNAYNIHVDPATSEIFVALPGFSDKTIKLTATVGSDTYTYTSPSAKSFEDGKYYAVTVGLAKKVLGFSIDPTHQIEFSRGNLQYKASENKWRFAENQYDYVGTYYTAHYFSGYYNRRTNYDAPVGNVYEGGTKCNNTDYYTDLMSTDCWIDLFGWNTWDKPTLVSIHKEDYASTQAEFVDWGHNTIHDTKAGISYAPDTWRTLKKSEWEYIVWGRPNAEQLCGLASIDGMPYGNVKGLILLPNEFVLPDGLTFHCITDPDNSFQMSYNGSATNPEYSGAMAYPNATSDRPAADIFLAKLAENLEHEKYMFNQNRYTQAEWEQMESAGAVFLPAAGWAWTLYPNSSENPDEDKYRYPFFENFLLAYWSANLASSEAYYLMINFQEAKVGMATEPVIDARSVRLVRDL